MTTEKHMQKYTVDYESKTVYAEGDEFSTNFTEAGLSCNDGSGQDMTDRDDIEDALYERYTSIPGNEDADIEVEFVGIINKNGQDEFGNDYVIQLLPRHIIEERIENFEPEEMIEKALEEHCDMQGFRTRLYIDCETGELDPHGLLGQTYLQKQAHRVQLAVFSNPVTEGLKVEDLLDPEEIDKCNEKGIEYWDYIDDMDSEKYRQRLVEALGFYFDLNWYNINEQLDRIYN